jgi:hypothetical protein
MEAKEAAAGFAVLAQEMRAAAFERAQRDDVALDLECLRCDGQHLADTSASPGEQKRKERALPFHVFHNFEDTLSLRAVDVFAFSGPAVEAEIVVAEFGHGSLR